MRSRFLLFLLGLLAAGSLRAQVPASAPAGPRMGAPLSDADFMQKRGGTLVLIRDAHGAGSGFLATLGAKPYLFTNAHVLAGARQPTFTLLDGTRLVPVSIELAAGHDLVRVALQTPPAQTLEVASDLGQTTRLGDEVFVLGNSGGGGVVTSLRGKLVGLGPDRVEVDSPFVPGNSGSPIIHAPSGLVIGIATYLIQRRDEFGSRPRNREGSEAVITRRFGYRLDSVKAWQPVNLRGFENEADQLERVKELTTDLIAFLDGLQRREPPNFKTDSLRRAVTDWKQATSRKGLSETDRRFATDSFLHSLRALCRGDVLALQQSLRYDYFRRELAEQREMRDQLYEVFNKDAQSFGR